MAKGGSSKNNVSRQKQLEKFGPDGISYLNKSSWLKKYIARKGTASASTASTYRTRLNSFLLFTLKEKKSSDFDLFVKDSAINPYDLLADYASWLRSEGASTNDIILKVKTSKKFLRFCGITIDNEDFKDNVTLPRREHPEFIALDKNRIVELLNACKDMRLKTALMLFGAMGCRALEGCAVRLCDVDFDKNLMTFRAEYTKMRHERTRPMTSELKSQLQTWLKVKYRPHRISHLDGSREYVQPKSRPDDLILAVWRKNINDNPSPGGVYDALAKAYKQLTDTLDMKSRNGRKEITFHSLRRFAKSTISDLGQQDYSEWFIGHSGSTYYRKTDKERAEIFRKVEPYLTFLDVAQLEAKGADQQTRLDQMQIELQKEREERTKLYELLYKQGIIKKE